MFLECSAAQVRRKIYIRRLDRFSRDWSNRVCDLVMKKSRHALVVGDVAARTLLVSQANASGTNRLAIVAAQSSNMKWMNQVADRPVSPFEKLLRSLLGELLSFS